MFWLLALSTIQRIKKKSCECGVVFSQVYFFFLETLTRCILDRRYFHKKNKILLRCLNLKLRDFLSHFYTGML